MRRTIAIIGAGPGGLSAAMLLSHQGHAVTVFEKAAETGGRNAPLRLGPYTFDTGPTFHLLPRITEELFARTGRDIASYLEMKTLDPLYRLRFDGADFLPSTDHEATAAQVERLFPGDGEGYSRFIRDMDLKVERVMGCLELSYSRPWHYLRPTLLRAVPHLELGRTVYGVLSRYFRHEEMRIAMAFQAKYLGMSPWDCPGAFSILSAMEHLHGLQHPIGGLHRISAAMAAVAREEGADIRLSCPVRRVLSEGGRATGVELEDGSRFAADDVVINADFAHAMSTLVDAKDRRHYTDRRLERKRYSCSTFMLYLGVDARYEMPHHSIVFSRDYRRNVEDIVAGRLPQDPSFYVQNASVTDPTLAPPGHSAIYVLVPVANAAAGIDWTAEAPAFREKILTLLEQRTEMTDLRSRIREERMVTPADWNARGVYRGAVFNLAHTLDQMLYMRPHNAFEDLRNCYIVGGGTQPGSGLPTIIQSGKICADLIGHA